MKLNFTKNDIFLFITISLIALGLGIYLPFTIPIRLVDPKPKLPPEEENRVYHPRGFSIIAPEGWKSFVDSNDSNDLSLIVIQPDTNARWAPKLFAQLYTEKDNPCYVDSSLYSQEKFLEYDAEVYEGRCGAYHQWQAVFLYEGDRYSVGIMLPHGEDETRYNKVPDYWWPFINSFHVESAASNTLD